MMSTEKARNLKEGLSRLLKADLTSVFDTLARQQYTGKKCIWFLMTACLSSVLIVLATVQLVSYFNWPTRISLQEVPILAYEYPSVTICMNDPLIIYYDLGNFVVKLNKFSILGEDPCFDYTGECELEKAYHYFGINITGVSWNREGWLPVDGIIDTIQTGAGICGFFNTSKMLAAYEEDRGKEAGSIPLELLIGINQYDFYVPGERKGIIVTLHEGHLPPHPLSDRTLVPVDASCSLKFVKKTTESLTYPYIPVIGDTCVDTRSPGFQNPLKRFDVYTKQTCEEECTVDYVTKTCGCRYFLHPGNETLCDMGQIINCVKEARLDAARRIGLCNCSETCYGSQFKVSMSCAELHQSNRPVVHLEIRSDGPLKRLVKQEPLHSFDSLVGALGGMVGLFLGFSLVTVVQVLEIICLYCGVLCARRRRKGDRSCDGEPPRCAEPDIHTIRL